MKNLTEFWRGNGCLVNRKPVDFLRCAGSEFKSDCKTTLGKFGFTLGSDDAFEAYKTWLINGERKNAFKFLESVDINRSSTDLAKEFGCSDSYMRKCRRMMSQWVNTQPNQHTNF